MLAATVDSIQVGNPQYQNLHMGKLFTEGFSFSGFERDKLYVNDQGKGFVEVSGLSGLDSVSDGRGAVYFDADNDGDYDIFLTALQGQTHFLYRNNIGQDNGYIRVTLVGTQSGKDAYGTQVRLKTSQGLLTKIKAGGSGFVSQSDPRLLFGLGEDDQAEWLEVEWPSGTHQRFEGIPARSSVRLVEGGQLEFLQERQLILPDPADDQAVFLQALSHRPGDLFPAVKMTNMEGQVTDFHTYRRPDQTYLINFWATYCVPCRKEMPELEKLSRSLDSVEIIGLSLDMGSAQQKVPAFIKRMGVTYPNFIADKTIFPEIFSGEQVFIPLSFLVNGQGRIIEILTGWSDDAEQRLRHHLAD